MFWTQIRRNTFAMDWFSVDDFNLHRFCIMWTAASRALVGVDLSKSRFKELLLSSGLAVCQRSSDITIFTTQRCRCKCLYAICSMFNKHSNVTLALVLIWLFVIWLFVCCVFLCFSGSAAFVWTRSCLVWNWQQRSGRSGRIALRTNG